MPESSFKPKGSTSGWSKRASVSAGASSADGFDLGPSWFWPEMQPQLAALVRDSFMSRSPCVSLGNRNIRKCPREEDTAENVLAETSVKQIVLGPANVTLTIAKADGSEDAVVAGQVIAGVPPTLLAEISFSYFRSPYGLLDSSALHRLHLND